MQPTSRRIPGANGVELHLLEWSREGVPLLLVHGFGNEAHIWDDFAPSVAPYYHVLALDLRGHGDSDWDSEGRYDYPDHVADLEAVVDQLEATRLVLVGHSLGARVCMLFAGRHPDRVAGFVAVDSAPELDRRGTLRIRLDVEEHRDPCFESIAEYENMVSLAYPAARPSAVQRMARWGVRRRDDGKYVLKMDPALRGAGARSLGARELAEREKKMTAELWACLEKLRCPTLVVRGAASDVMSAEVADRMVEETIPQATLAVVAQAGHSVMTDNPDGFRDAVCAFVLGDD